MFINAPEGCPHGTHTSGTAYRHEEAPTRGRVSYDMSTTRRQTTTTRDAHRVCIPPPGVDSGEKTTETDTKTPRNRRACLPNTWCISWWNRRMSPLTCATRLTPGHAPYAGHPPYTRLTPDTRLTPALHPDMRPSPGPPPAPLGVSAHTHASPPHPGARRYCGPGTRWRRRCSS